MRNPERVFYAGKNSIFCIEENIIAGNVDKYSVQRKSY